MTVALDGSNELRISNGMTKSSNSFFSKDYLNLFDRKSCRERKRETYKSLPSTGSLLKRA